MCGFPILLDDANQFSNAYSQVEGPFPSMDNLVTLGGIVSLDQMTQLAVGFGTNCGITALGALRCWGFSPFLGPTSGSNYPRLGKEDARGANFVYSVAGVTEFAAFGSRRLAKKIAMNVPSGAATLGLLEKATFVCVLYEEEGVSKLACISADGKDNSSGMFGTDSADYTSSNDIYSVGADVYLATGLVKCTSVVPYADIVELVGGGNHFCVRSTDNVICWGSNSMGQAGQHTSVALRFGTLSSPMAGLPAVPVGVASAYTLVGLAAGQDHTCVLHKDSGTGAVNPRCWGLGTGYWDMTRSNYGTFGLSVSSSPLLVLPEEPASIVAGVDTTMVISVTGLLYCFGLNSGKSCGVATSPVLPSAALLPVAFLPGEGAVVSVSVSASHACAAFAGGRVRCWGVPNNTNGPTIGAGTTGLVPASAAASLRLGRPHLWSASKIVCQELSSCPLSLVASTPIMEVNSIAADLTLSELSFSSVATVTLDCSTSTTSSVTGLLTLPSLAAALGTSGAAMGYLWAINPATGTQMSMGTQVFVHRLTTVVAVLPTTIVSSTGGLGLTVTISSPGVGDPNSPGFDKSQFRCCFGGWAGIGLPALLSAATKSGPGNTTFSCATPTITNGTFWDSIAYNANPASGAPASSRSAANAGVLLLPVSLSFNGGASCGSSGVSLLVYNHNSLTAVTPGLSAISVASPASAFSLALDAATASTVPDNATIFSTATSPWVKVTWFDSTGAAAGGAVVPASGITRGTAAAATLGTFTVRMALGVPPVAATASLVLSLNNGTETIPAGTLVVYGSSSAPLSWDPTLLTPPVIPAAALPTFATITVPIVNPPSGIASCLLRFNTSGVTPSSSALVTGSVDEDELLVSFKAPYFASRPPSLTIEISFMNGFAWDLVPPATLSLSWLTSLSPPIGPTSGGTLITVNGAGFSPPWASASQLTDIETSASCKFGAASTTSYEASILSDSQLTCSAPSQADVGGLASVPVFVTLNANGDYTTDSQVFSFYVQPTISPGPLLLPSDPLHAYGPASAITLTALPFPAAVHGAPVCSVEALSFHSRAISYDAALGRVVCPSFDASASVQVRVTFNAGPGPLDPETVPGDLTSSGLTVTFFGPQSFSPALVPSETGGFVAVSGTGFSAALSMSCVVDPASAGRAVVGATPLTVTASRLGCALPARVPGSYPLTVALTAEASLRSAGILGSTSTITYYLSPRVTAVWPIVGGASGGIIMTLYGVNLAPPPGIGGFSCAFGPASVSRTAKVEGVSLNSTAATCAVPVGSGAVTLEASLNGQDYTRGSAAFTYLTLLSVSPDLGPASGGTRVAVTVSTALTAAMFQHSPHCLFFFVNGTNATAPAVLLSTFALQCVAPAASPAWSPAADLVVSLNGGRDYTKPLLFSYHPVPSGLTLTPRSGPSPGGNLVTISGQNLAAAGSPALPLLTVMFDAASTPGAAFRPAAPAGSGVVPVSFTYNAGADSYLVGSYTYFILASSTPPSGPWSGGTRLRISGSGFSSAASFTCRAGAISFPGVPISDALLECVTPAAPNAAAPASAPALVSVSADGAFFTAPVASAQFWFFPSPSITMVTPRTGPVSGGTQLTVYGTGFLNTAPLLSCRFSESALLTAAAVYVSPTEVRCNTTLREAGNVTVFLTLNGVDYGPQPLPGAVFEYARCKLGWFSRKDTDPCEPCPPGQISTTEGSQACSMCGIKAYANSSGSSTCAACPARTTISDAVSDSIEKCLCDKGTFSRSLRAGTACEECPEGASCAGAVEAPMVLRGFWSDAAAPFSFIRCDTESQCPGGASNTCAEGHSGRLCSVCLPGYYKNRLVCTKCPSYASALMIGFAVFCVLLALVLLKSVGVEGAHRYGGTINVATDFFQVLAIIGRLRLNWPPEFKRVIDALTAPFFISSDILATECSVPSVTYQVKWVSTMMIPFLFAGIFLGFYILALLQHVVVRGLGGRRREQLVSAALAHHRKLTELRASGALERGNMVSRWLKRTAVSAKNVMWKLLTEPIDVVMMMDRCCNAYLLFFGLAYMLIISNTMAFFDCRRLSATETKWTLTADVSLLCYDRWWMKLLPVALTGIAVYVFGIPGLLALHMYRNRRVLRVPRFSRRYSSLYFEFRLGVPFWGSWDKLQKVLIAVASSFLSSWVHLQAVVLLLLFLVSLLFQRLYKPMADHRDNTLEATLRVAICAVLTGGILYKSGASLSGPAQTCLLVYVLACVISAAAFVLWTVGADLYYIYKDEKAEAPRPLVIILSKLACPTGRELVIELAKSYPPGDPGVTRMCAVLESIVGESEEGKATGSSLAPASRAKLTVEDRLIDHFTSYVFSPEVLGTVGRWVKARVEAGSALVRHLEAGEQLRLDSTDPRVALFAELLAFQETFVTVSIHARRRASINTALPFTKPERPRPSRIPTMKNIGSDEIFARNRRRPHGAGGAGSGAGSGRSTGVRASASLSPESPRAHASGGGGGELADSDNSDGGDESLPLFVEAVVGLDGALLSEFLGVVRSRGWRGHDTLSAALAAAEQVRSSRFVDQEAFLVHLGSLCRVMDVSGGELPHAPDLVVEDAAAGEGAVEGFRHLLRRASLASGLLFQQTLQGVSSIGAQEVEDEDAAAGAGAAGGSEVQCVLM